ncbi:FtsK/SpoIIIE domain-containing protein, partial [Candidatus Thioglobus sp.]|nr:FtsK/SpoIIIE domain-containing protein [Candidatus Thioglobus sp.]
HSDTVELLLKHKANIEAVDKAGNTSLIWAVREHRSDAVEILLRNNAIISKEFSKQIEMLTVTHPSKEYFDSIKSYLIDPIFEINMYEVKLPGPVIFRIKDYEITKLGVELSYFVVDAEYDSVNWLGYQAEFENRTQLDNVKLHADLGNELFKVLIYGNDSLGRLLKEFKVHGRAPSFYDADIVNHSCCIFLKNLNGVTIEHWIDASPLAEDLLNFSIEIEEYNSEHSLWGEYGNSKLMIIKESSISSLAKALDLSGTFVKESESKGIRNIVYNNVDDSQLWLEKEDEICILLRRQVHVIVDGSKIYLEDNIEEALPALMEWDDNSDNPKLLHVKKAQGRVDYYYSYSHKKNLAKWKDAARVVDFKTLFDEPNKVYELQNYDKSNSELWNPEFSKERMIVLCEYDAIPTKEELIGIDVSQELTNKEVFWGYGTGSDKYYSKINNLSHMMIIGASGSGKSNFMNGVILSLLKNLNQIQKMYLIDLKSGIEFNRYKGFSEKVDVFSKGTSPSRLLSALREVEAEMYLREEYMSHNGITKLTTDPIFIIIDEYAQIQLMPAKGSESMIKDDIVNTLVTIGTRARSANIKLIVQTQDPRAVEDELKVHLMSRALLKTSKEADAGFTLQDDDKAYEMGIKHTSFDQGRYIFEDYNDGNTQTTELQFPFIDPDKKLYEAYSSVENEAYTGIELNEYKESISAQYPHLKNTKLLGNGKEVSQEDTSNAQPSPQPQASDSLIDFDSIGDDVDETSNDSDEDDKEIANLAKEGDDLYKALLSQIDED